MEGRAPSRPLALGGRPRRSVALQIRPQRSVALQIRPRRSVALQITRKHLQNAHKLRGKGLYPGRLRAVSGWFRQATDQSNQDQLIAPRLRTVTL